MASENCPSCTKYLQEKGHCGHKHSRETLGVGACRHRLQGRIRGRQEVDQERRKRIGVDSCGTGETRDWVPVRSCVTEGNRPRVRKFTSP